MAEENPDKEKTIRTINKVLYPTTPLKVKMLQDCVFPDVLPEFPPALVPLEITYSYDIKVNIGNVLSPKQVKDVPFVTWQAEPDAYYLLCMIDPDAPCREKPRYREWHHWLVGNIPQDHLYEGEILSDYIGAGPPKDTGKHRYVFFLFKQKEKIEFYEQHLTNKTTKKRALFNLQRFATAYNLGDPVAANYFLAEYDNYVPILYKQLHCC